MAAMNMQQLTRSLLLFRITGSAAIMGAMMLVNAVPMLLLSLFGGIIADRVQKKYVLLIGQAALSAVSLGIALSLSSGYLSAENASSWWILIVASLIEGSVMALVMPSRQSMLAEIVKGEDLMNAISLNTMGMNAFRLFGPAIAGFLIDAIGFEAVYFVTSGMYLTSVVFVALLPRTSSVRISGESVWTSMKGGIGYIRKETTILLVIIFTLTAAMLAMPYQMLMPVFTETVLNVGARQLGILMSVSGAGAMVGSLILASLPNKRRGLMLLGSGILLGLSLASFSLSNSWYASLAMVSIVGLAQSGQMAVGTTLIQYYVDPKYMGRVMSIMLMQWGLVSFGAFIAGILTESLGVQMALGGFAVLLVLMSTATLIFVPRIRRLE